MTSENLHVRTGERVTLAVPATGAGTGLLLRPWAEHDIPAMLAAHRDPLMRRWLRRPLVTEEQARQLIEAQRADRRAGTAFGFAIVPAEPDGGAGPLAGYVSVRGLGAESAIAEVGYWITAAARGQGIAGRAVNAVREWAVRLPRATPLERFHLIHTIGNQASCRVADKTGFRLSATLPPQPPDFPGPGHLHIWTPERLPVVVTVLRRDGAWR